MFVCFHYKLIQFQQQNYLMYQEINNYYSLNVQQFVLIQIYKFQKWQKTITRSQTLKKILLRKKLHKDIKDQHQDGTINFQNKIKIQVSIIFVKYPKHTKFLVILQNVHFTINTENKNQNLDSSHKDVFYKTNLELKGGYRFAKNPDQIFEKFFHNNNNFAQVFDKQLNTHGSIFSHAFGAQNYEQAKNVKNLEVEIACSLNELYNGCSKLVTYTKTKLNLDGRTTSNINQNKLIEIKSGYSKNTQIIFEKQGHQAPDGTISDLIFKIKQIQHPKFKRLHNDLLYTAQISLKHALNSQSVDIITLDGRKLLVSFDEIINPHTVKQVVGEGMPIQSKKNLKIEDYGKKEKKGNLYIKFDIHFPNHLTQEQKSKLKRLL